MDGNKLNIFDVSEFDTSNESHILNITQRKLDDVPNQFSDYMCTVHTRFSEICRLYLKGLSFDDLKFIHEKDLIKLVPPNQYHHKLLMIILVRRYLHKFMYKDCNANIEQQLCCQVQKKASEKTEP